MAGAAESTVKVWHSRQSRLTWLRLSKRGFEENARDPDSTQLNGSSGGVHELSPLLRSKEEVIRVGPVLYTGGINAKIHGVRHLYVQYLGKPQRPVRLYQPFNNRQCLHCHAGARSFEQGATHSAIMDDIKSNQMSCVSSGCHDMVHNVAQLDHLKYWRPQP